MTRRFEPVVVFAIVVALAVAWLAMIATRPAVAGVRAVEPSDVPFVLAFLVFSGVGTLIARHRAGSSVGWLLLAAGASQVVYSFTQEYAIRGLLVGDRLPWADVAAWISFNISPLGFAAFPLLLFVFPTGRPPSPGWRWAVRVTAAAAAIVIAGAVANWPLRGPEMLAAAPDITSEIADTLFLTAMGVLSLSLVLACVSLVVRYRRAARDERLQLKWVVFAGGLVAAVVVLDSVGVLGGNDPLLVSITAATAIAGVPVAFLVAITRYRLYEIDRIVSRTVTWALVTVVLAGTYAVAITLLTAATTARAGGSPLAVAAATLATAAAFGPVRRRIQSAVDRRFNRARYDAARVAEAYRARLRYEVNLASVQSDLLSTVDAAVQPRTALLWLPGGAS